LSPQNGWHLSKKHTASEYKNQRKSALRHREIRSPGKSHLLVHQKDRLTGKNWCNPISVFQEGKKASG
jgi:hypothetical protein